MSCVINIRPRALAGLLLAAFALPGLANTFAISPNTISFPFKWNVSIDGAAVAGNPTLVVMTGQTYSFVTTNVAGHPFWIDQATGLGGAAASAPYPVGDDLSANGVTSNTTVSLNLPADAPDNLYYACGVHSSMIGTITVVHDLVFRANFE
jgi:hypothetical protein